MAENTLKRKLPAFIGEEPQISSLLDVAGQEISSLESALETKIKGFYIESLSGSEALSAWERDFAIQNIHASEDERKMEILSKLNMSGTVTKEALKTYISQLTGKSVRSIEEKILAVKGRTDVKICQIVINLMGGMEGLTSPQVFQRALRGILPAHVIYRTIDQVNRLGNAQIYYGVIGSEFRKVKGEVVDD